MLRKLALWICRIRGHRPMPRRHPQQWATQCYCCRHIVTPLGEIIAPPFRAH